MAPALGAMGFAAMMTFADGGIVPGIENGDVVPAMLTPGEGIIPGQCDGQALDNGAGRNDGQRRQPLQREHARSHACSIDGLGGREPCLHKALGDYTEAL